MFCDFLTIVSVSYVWLQLYKSESLLTKAHHSKEWVAKP